MRFHLDLGDTYADSLSEGSRITTIFIISQNLLTSLRGRWQDGLDSRAREFSTS